MQQHSEWEKKPQKKQQKKVSVNKWKYLSICGCSGNTRFEECQVSLFILRPTEIRTKNVPVTKEREAVGRNTGGQIFENI